MGKPFHVALSPAVHRAGVTDESPWQWERGLVFDGKCLVEAPLPGYSISEMGTGQYTGEGPIWKGSFGIVEPADDRKAAP